MYCDVYLDHQTINTFCKANKSENLSQMRNQEFGVKNSSLHYFIKYKKKILKKQELEN